MIQSSLFEDESAVDDSDIDEVGVEQFFQTPPRLADAWLKLWWGDAGYPGGTVVDLGAGKGALCDALVRAGVPLAAITAVELHPGRAAFLRKHGYAVVEANVMEWAGDQPRYAFDFALSNPPYNCRVANGFIRTGLHLAPRFTTLTLINLLAAQSRTALRRDHPFDAYVLFPRPDFSVDCKDNNPRDHLLAFWAGKHPICTVSDFYWNPN
jgi:hypothetical protein